MSQKCNEALTIASAEVKEHCISSRDPKISVVKEGVWATRRALLCVDVVLPARRSKNLF